MKNPLNSLAIVLIGNELLNGSIQDKNAKLLLEKLSIIKNLTLEVVTVPDNAERIQNTIRRLEASFQVIVTSGGLGPTTDDITIESIAKAFGLEITENSESKERLIEKYRKRGRNLTQNSYKQTLFPKNATILPNEVGTADSCIVHTVSSHICCFPGVPSEFSFFIQGSFWNWLNSEFNLGAPPTTCALTFFGLSEAYIGSVIESMQLPPSIQVAYRPHFPETLVIISSNEHDELELKKISGEIENKIGHAFILGKNSETNLPLALLLALKESNNTLATAESCTGGRIASEITKISGSSSVFLGGFVTYSNEMKKTFLDIDSDILKAKGAVSEEVAISMALNARIKTGSSYAISTTGIAGPTGGTANKSVGLIYIGISHQEFTKSVTLELPWDRNRNQIYASWYAMNLVWRSIKRFDLEWKSL